MTAESYQQVLSEKTQLLIQLEQQKQALQAQEDRKSELIAAIAEASAQIDSADSDAQSLQSQIVEMQSELDQLESSLSKEAKQVYNAAMKTLNKHVELCKKYNQHVREAEKLFKEIVAPLDQAELANYRIGLSAAHPISNLENWEFRDYAKFVDLPEFAKRPEATHVRMLFRRDKDPNAL